MTPTPTRYPMDFPRIVEREQLISAEYLSQQRKMHLYPQGYGGKGARWAETVAWLASSFDAMSILDYGCGRGTLRVALEARGLVCREYDPAIEGKNALPSFADLVVCTDVLEHVEREKVPAVLSHIRSLARKGIFAVISLRLANKVLPDGRNAHITLEKAEWWAKAATAAGWDLMHVPGIPMPAKVNPEKAFIVAARPTC